MSRKSDRTLNWEVMMGLEDETFDMMVVHLLSLTQKKVASMAQK